MFLNKIEKIKKEQLDILRKPTKNVFELFKKNRFNIIAEIKKASPSLGDIFPDADILKIADEYIQNGAAAISVLTETEYFKGNIEYLKKIREFNKNIILLRKDFIIDEIQLYEAKFSGADMVLLILALTGEKRTKELIKTAKEIGLEVLLEVHDENEMQIALNLDVNFIGVNNRDLKTLKVDINTSEKLSKYIIKDKIFVSESGFNNIDDIMKMLNLGYNTFLIGTYFMSSNNQSNTLNNLCKTINMRLENLQ